MHCDLAAGYWEEWLSHLATLAAELAAEAVLHPGHGAPAGLELLSWQRRYIEQFVEALRSADWSDTELPKRSVLEARPNTWETMSSAS
jgi:hypothetical protein